MIVKDVEYTPYSEYVIPVGELYIHVGMIFDSKHKPYFEGKELSLGDDNIFFQITKDDRAVLVIIWMCQFSKPTP